MTEQPKPKHGVFDYARRKNGVPETIEVKVVYDELNPTTGTLEYVNACNNASVIHEIETPSSTWCDTFSPADKCCRFDVFAEPEEGDATFAFVDPKDCSDERGPRVILGQEGFVSEMKGGQVFVCMFERVSPRDGTKIRLQGFRAEETSKQFYKVEPMDISVETPVRGKVCPIPFSDKLRPGNIYLIRGTIPTDGKAERFYLLIDRK